MKLREIMEASHDEKSYEDRLRSDGKLKERLKIIDRNIEMFSALGPTPSASNKQQVDSLKRGREALEKFYAGKIKMSDVPYSIWELTTGIPDWGTYGT